MPEFVQKAQRGETIRRLAFRFHFRREMAQSVRCFLRFHFGQLFVSVSSWKILGEIILLQDIDIILFLSITIYNEQKKKKLN